jgi:hypothetical protein
MSAELLGQRATQIAEQQTADAILRLGPDSATYQTLIWEMANGADTMFDRSAELLHAFFYGFRGAT